MNIPIYVQQCQKRINSVLKKKLSSLTKEPQSLHQAMAYSLLNGGKRLRATLTYCVGELFHADPEVLDDVASAIEILHAFSLVHDDLPALDNDDLRRGVPTCHKVFGESTAILAGDALQSLAFEIISSLNPHYITPNMNLKLVKLLAITIGSKGVAGGEEMDLKMALIKHPTLSLLKRMYYLKTGCLLVTSVLAGALAAGCQNLPILYHLEKFSEYLGLAFQIHDDIIGIESDTKTLGKTQGADLALNKPIYPVVAGMKKAKAHEHLFYKKALFHLNQTGLESTQLKKIALYLIERNY